MKPKIETIFAEEVKNSTAKKGCSSCKNKNKNKYFTWLVVASTYLFATSIYGSYVLIKKLLEIIF